MKPTPQKAAALLALRAAASHTLVRCRGGFRPVDATTPVVTVRTVNALDAEGLISLDDPQFPSVARLSSAGHQAATQLAQTAKAGAA